jgi:deazaflavin-dependent oxidoreductase (nitroreductase family)
VPDTAESALAGPVAAAAARLLRVRWIVRAPVLLYRARLGFVLGSRLLMLEHTGRITATRRYVVLEVADRPRPGTYAVVSGFGDRAQWVRNVRAAPAVRVALCWHHPRPAAARVLGDREAAVALAGYAARHPRAWTVLKPVLEAAPGVRAGDPRTGPLLVAFDLGPAPAACRRDS